MINRSLFNDIPEGIHLQGADHDIEAYRALLNHVWGSFCDQQGSFREIQGIFRVQGLL